MTNSELAKGRSLGAVQKGEKHRGASRFQRQRRRRSFIRWSIALALVLFPVGTFVYSIYFSPAPTSAATVLPYVAPVEVGALPASPDPASGPDMSLVWSAAVVRDPSPSLATFGRTTTSEGRIALTFDDGPDPLVTPQVLDTLREYDVEATFFVVGRYVAQYPEIVQRIVEEGHTLGNHTYNHPDMSTLDAVQLRRELQRTQRAVNKALGYRYPMFVMRPPYGHPYIDGSSNLALFQETVHKQELFPVLWTPSPQDYLFDRQPGKIVRYVRRHRAPGHKYDGVLLLHDTKQQTADALPRVIEYYLSEGLAFTGVHELLAAKYLDY